MTKEEKIDALLNSEFAETGDASSQFDKEAAYSKFTAMVAEAEEKEIQKRHRTLIYRMMRYAAIVIVVCAIGGGAFWGGGEMLRSQLADVTFSVPDGSRSKVTLPDGTVVTLNAGSTISYSQSYGLTTRDVKLSGEGFFEVAHDDSHPFSITTGQLTINDIGTSFNVCNYDDETRIEITMTDGRIDVRDADGKQLGVLKDKDRMIYDKISGKIITGENTKTRGTAWLDGVIHLEGESMEEIARMLERSFGVIIVFRDETKKDLHFHGDFSYKQDKIEDVLSTLAATGRLDFEKNDNKVTIY